MSSDIADNQQRICRAGLPIAGPFQGRSRDAFPDSRILSADPSGGGFPDTRIDVQSSPGYYRGAPTALGQPAPHRHRLHPELSPRTRHLQVCDAAAGQRRVLSTFECVQSPASPEGRAADAFRQQQVVLHPSRLRPNLQICSLILSEDAGLSPV